MLKEQMSISYDKQKKFRGAVKNSLARFNVVIADYDQEPQYESGKGRIINFKRLPHLKKLRKCWETVLGPIASNLNCEGNFYYDLSKCGIGYHGDGERRIVIGCRLGDSFPLVYKWFKNSEAVSREIRINLNGGDLFFMEDKAVGWDWKKKKVYSLRHSAGCDKYTKAK
ncbi:MAG: hypothetical protein P1U85_21160 [Verrucomicrobiales bacterium]|nr:hypothetical protein [Verrucomicrobiales bacterium]